MRPIIAAILTALAFAVLPFAGSTADAKEPVYQSLFGTAIDGTDPVAYFTEGRPVEGSSDITHEWNGAKWRFSSTRRTARSSPRTRKPTRPSTAATAPGQSARAIRPRPIRNAWKIVDGKLYLNYNKSVQSKWEQNIPGNIQAADKNWPGIVN